MAGRDFKINKLIQHWEFALIFLLALGLRLWNLHEADFTHDELSALVRTQFQSFGDLITQAVRPDGHPALAQVFLFYWAPWVEYSEFWIKLPFVMAGLGSILLVYLGLHTVFPGDKTILAAPLIMASSELFVYNHQIARPYALGALFVSLAGYAYLRWFYHSKSKSNLWQFAIAATLASYTHYLALLSVLIIGVSALIREKEHVKLWWITGIVVLGLFSPHLGVFLDQLSLGGVGQWLGKPKADWLVQFFDYTFNFSTGATTAALLALLLLINGLQSNFKEGWAWFLSCFGVAFLYSIYRNPVLQFSSLLFLAPFVFTFPFSSKSKPWLISITSFLVLSLLTLSLILEREYFKEAQLSPPKEVFRFTEGQSQLKVFYHWSQEKWEFYQKINPETLDGQYLEELNVSELPEQGFILILDHQSPGYWPLAICDYGFEIIKSEKHFGFSIYQFGGLHEREENDNCGFRLMEKRIEATKAQQYQKLGTLQSSTHLADQPQYHVAVQFKDLLTGPDCHLIFQIMDGDEQVSWFAHPIDSSSEYLSRPIGQYGINQYTWNVLIDQGEHPIIIKGEVLVRLVAGNEKIYGLVQDFQ